MTRAPKLFIIRHGETEWTINGRFTGTSDIPLTANGEAIIERLGLKAVGAGKLIDPSLLSRVLVSPRRRAQKTYELLFSNSNVKPTVETEELVREWTYGDYEGLHLHEIVDTRRYHGIQSTNTDWDIWVDGCEGGESAQDLADRADEVVNKVKEIHKQWIQDPKRESDDVGGDVLVVSHGHFSRCLLTRWLGLPLSSGGLFSLDPGGVCVLGYSRARTPCLLSMNIGSL